MTRPDITFVVSVLSQYMQDPQQCHWDACYKVLRYLKGNIGLGVLYKKGSKLDIVGYSDAD